MIGRGRLEKERVKSSLGTAMGTRPDAGGTLEPHVGCKRPNAASANAPGYAFTAALIRSALAASTSGFSIWLVWGLRLTPEKRGMTW